MGRWRCRTGRPWPLYFKEYLAVARGAGLSCAEGRAIYACNRRQMGWPWEYGDEYARLVEPLDLMQQARQTTARRWLAHWKGGGHIRSLKHSHDEWNARRREADKERRASYKSGGR